MRGWGHFFVGVGFYEPGKLKLLGFLFFLYTKLDRKKIEDHESRREILGFIKGQPGVNYSNIVKLLGMGNSSVAHHLNVLERENYIKSYKVGMFRCYFPKKRERNGKIQTDTLNELQRDIILALRSNPDISQSDIAGILEVSQQRVNYNIKQLRKMDIVMMKKQGFKSSCSINMENIKELPSKLDVPTFFALTSICPKCGTKVRLKAKYCDRCGEKLHEKEIG